MKIMYVASEVAPFIKTGGLGDVAGSLPKALALAGHEVSVFCPYYDQISAAMKSKLTRAHNFYVDLGWRRQFCSLYTYEMEGVQFYFLDNKYYFSRPNVYGEYDDGERFAFFCKAVLQVLPDLGTAPDVLHCNDWQTALIPIYHSLQYRDTTYYQNIRTVFTIHNIEYQGWYYPEALEEVFGVDSMHFHSGLLAMGEMVNLMKGAIELADAVTTVSPTYAQEIRTVAYGEGLEDVLRMHEGKLHGVINGLDCTVFNPETDPAVEVPYTAATIDKKAQNREVLLSLAGLSADATTPVLCMVSRLAAHKGLELIEAVLEDILQGDVRLIVLGTGEARFEQMFARAQQEYPEKVRLFQQFSVDIASKIYAGADILLMPSRSEPCGLSQMIAMRYGTIPLVRETGGLQDTVQPYVDFLGVGDGFTVHSYNAHDMLHVIREACALFATKPEAWRKMQVRDMERDFTWSASAKVYLGVYVDTLLGRK